MMTLNPVSMTTVKIIADLCVKILTPTYFIIQTESTFWIQDVQKFGIFLRQLAGG